MTFMLLQRPVGTSVLTDAPLIKADELAPLEHALALLRQAEEVVAQAKVEAEQLRETGYAEGQREGIAAAHAVVAERLAGLAVELADQQRRRDDDLATAALAAVEAIIGAGGVAAIGPALVQQALAGFVGHDAVTVEVAPALAAALGPKLAGRAAVTIVENAEMGPLDCELRTGRGTISAGLDVQLAALAERWKVAP